jgi:hypothetical protein
MYPPVELLYANKCIKNSKHRGWDIAQWWSLGCTPNTPKQTNKQKSKTEFTSKTWKIMLRIATKTGRGSHALKTSVLSQRLWKDCRSLNMVTKPRSRSTSPGRTMSKRQYWGTKKGFIQMGMVAHTCNPRPWESDAEGLQLPSQLVHVDHLIRSESYSNKGDRHNIGAEMPNVFISFQSPIRYLQAQVKSQCFQHIHLWVLPK